MRPLAVLIATGILGALPATAGYSYCQPITIRHTMVPNTDQPNYVLTINDTDPGLAAVGNGGYVHSPSGLDIVFASDSLGNNLLNWDPLEAYNSSTGKIITHVQVGTVSHTADTTIYRCAGNSGVSSFQGGAAGVVWPASYIAVYHLGNGLTLSAADSTSNARNGTATGVTAAAGEIDGAASFANSTDRILLNADTLWPSGAATTISAWIKPASLGDNAAIVRFSNAYNATVLYVTGQHLSFYYGQPTVLGATPLAAGAWYHVTLVSNGSGNSATLYINGAVDGTGTLSNQAAGPNSGGYIGSDPSIQLNGLVDEVRISNAAFSADRIATDYNNQSNPLAFYSRGSWALAAPATSAISQSFVF